MVNCHLLQSSIVPYEKLAAFLMDRPMARFLCPHALKSLVRKVDGLIEVCRVDEAGRVNEQPVMLTIHVLSLAEQHKKATEKIGRMNSSSIQAKRTINLI